MKSIIGKILAIFGIIILFCLGIWQLERMKYKNALIKSLEENLLLPEITLNSTPTEEYIYKKVKLCGFFSNDKMIYVYDKPDYIILSPFYMDNNHESDYAVIVARGIIKQDQNLIIASNNKKEKFTCINSIVLPSEKKPIFMPKADGTRKKPLLSINIESIQEILGLNSPNFYLFLTSEDKVINSQIKPFKLPTSINITNNHLEYAVTWFILCLILAFMTFYSKKAKK